MLIAFIFEIGRKIIKKSLFKKINDVNQVFKSYFFSGSAIKWGLFV